MRDSVVVIGTGMMGSGIAAISALAGNRTIMLNPDREQALTGVDNARRDIRELLNHKLTTADQAAGADEMLIAADQAEAAAEQAKLMIEAVPEVLSLKQEVFRQWDDWLPPDVPMLSNTSGLRITDIAILMKHPERAVTAHFWFPAHLVPLVEVVIGEMTEREIAVQVRDTLESWGKKPIIVNKDLPGQLANRILQAVIREAVNIVETGLATPEDVDTAVKMGMGIRFPAWGPLEHIDAVGLDLCTSVQDQVLPEISNATSALLTMKDLVANGNLGYKTGKGIYDWSQKDMDELKNKRNEFIIHALKKLM